jgi:hypothetical protein
MFVGSNVANQGKKVKNDENILPTRQNHKDLISQFPMFETIKKFHACS